MIFLTHNRFKSQYEGLTQFLANDMGGFEGKVKEQHAYGISARLLLFQEKPKGGKAADEMVKIGGWSREEIKDYLEDILE